MVTVNVQHCERKKSRFALYGHKAKLDIGTSGERVELIPEKQFSEDIEMESFAGLQAEDIRVHEKTGSIPFARTKCRMRTSNWL